MTRRWPLHPSPQPGEALSSWLTRIAGCYGMSLHELQDRGLGMKPLSAGKLDRDPPGALLDAIAARTAQDVLALRRMTMRGHVPALLERLDGAPYYYNAYALQYSVLTYRRRSQRLPSWRPWLSDNRYPYPVHCPACIAEHGIGFMRLHWRLSIATSCPEHGVILLTGAEARSRRAKDSVAALDMLTLDGLESGNVRLPTGTLRFGVWIRLLRSLLDELNNENIRHDERDRLRHAWHSAGEKLKPSRLSWVPYEMLRPDRQRTLMRVASVVIPGIAAGRTDALGAHCRYLQQPDLAPSEPEYWQPFPEVHAEFDWQHAFRDFKALVAAARGDDALAAQFRQAMLIGQTAPDRVAAIDELLRDLGIPVALSRPRAA